MSDLPPQSSAESGAQPGDRRPRPFEGVPKAVLWLVGCIVAAHLAFIPLSLDWKNELYVRFSLVPSFYTTADTPYTSLLDRILPLIGHPFLHAGFIHLAFNCIAILDLGANVARTQGSRNFLIVFFASAIGGAFAFILINPAMNTPAVGASGAACGLFGAYAMEALMRARGVWAGMRRRLIWRATFWFLAINVGLMAALRLTDVFPIAWEAHLGGFLTGMALAPFTMRRGYWASHVR